MLYISEKKDYENIKKTKRFQRVFIKFGGAIYLKLRTMYRTPSMAYSCLHLIYVCNEFRVGDIINVDVARLQLFINT